MRRQIILVSLLLAALGAAAGPAIVRVTAGSDAPASKQVLADIAYGSDPAQVLDVYRPTATGVGRPIIVMVHGGAWRIGDKDARGVVDNKVRHWIPKGFIFTTINYRMLPVLDGVAQADDVARALAFVQAQARNWGGDPAKVVLMGHSAGAHLVALLSAAPGRAKALGARSWLGAVALDSAALDLPALMSRRHLPLYDQAFGKDPTRWRAGSPLHALDAQALPMMVVCSSRRRDRPCDQAGKFAEQAASKGVRVLVLPQDLDHAGINRVLGEPGAYTDAVDRFLQSLGAAGSALPR